MKGLSVFLIIVVIWVTGLYWGYTKYIKRSTAQQGKEGTVSEYEVLREQHDKAQQVRDDQKRIMEDLKRKIRDQRR